MQSNARCTIIRKGLQIQQMHAGIHPYIADYSPTRLVLQAEITELRGSKQLAEKLNMSRARSPTTEYFRNHWLT